MADTDSAEASGLDAIGPELKELLTPLLAQRDQLQSEKDEIKEALKAKDGELKVIEKVLRAGGLIDSTSKGPSIPKPKYPSDDLMAPQPPTPPRTEAERKNQTKILEAIKKLNGEPFQVGMIIKRTGSDRRAIEKVVGVMRGEDRLALLGKQPQLERPTPGGKKAMTFQEVQR